MSRAKVTQILISNTRVFSGFKSNQNMTKLYHAVFQGILENFDSFSEAIGQRKTLDHF